MIGIDNIKESNKNKNRIKNISEFAYNKNYKKKKKLNKKIIIY